VTSDRIAPSTTLSIQKINRDSKKSLSLALWIDIYVLSLFQELM